LKQEDIDKRVKKILLAKYQYGLANWNPVRLEGLTRDLNKELPSMKRQIAENAITLLRSDIGMLPLTKGKKVAYVGVGLTKDNAFAEHVRQDYDAHVYYFSYKTSEAKIAPLLELLKNDYDVVLCDIKMPKVDGIEDLQETIAVRIEAHSLSLLRCKHTLLERLHRHYH